MRYIHPTAIVYDNVMLGNNIYIGPYCIIGAPAEVLATRPDNPSGFVIIGDGVWLEGHVTVDSGQSKDRRTCILDNCYLTKQTHVGHDSVLEANCILSPGARIGGECYLRNHVNVGMNAVIHQQTYIPAKCMIGMGAVVTKKAAQQMQEMQTWAGNPAKLIGPNKKWRTSLD